jgi:hypothetical protein
MMTSIAPMNADGRPLLQDVHFANRVNHACFFTPALFDGGLSWRMSLWTATGEKRARRAK